MPDLILEMTPEEGMHTRQDVEDALMRKAQLEKIRIEGASGGRIVAWDARPVFGKLTETLTLRWHYKQSQRKT